MRATKDKTLENTSHSEMRQWLYENNYLAQINHQEMISLLGVLLLTKMRVEELSLDSIGTQIAPNLLHKMRRGAKELQAKYSTDDMVTILYMEARAPKVIQ